MRKASIQEVLDKNGIMVIDGSMSTALEALGANTKSSLWTAAALAEQPELVKQVHLDYFRAGADCGITCSYQATIPGLTAHGYSVEEAERIIADSVRVFLEARDEWWEEEGREAGRAYPVCLAGIGPYGAYLADGSEYRGNYGVDDQTLYDFHRRRMEILAEAGADVALCRHTHAGQVFPGNLIVPLFNENAWGYKKLHGLDTFVTASVGHYGPPMRVGTDSEITVIHLKFAERGDM